MTAQESVFIRLLGEYLFGQPEPELEAGCETEVLRLSMIHNVLGICWSALKKRGGADDVLNRYKRAVIAQMVSQIRKTQAFLNFYSELLSSGICAVCVKGITLRTLYPEPDLRPSSDEDLIILEEEMELFEQVCERCGFETRHQNEKEITVFHPQSGLLIEAQTEFFLPDGALGEQMNALFSDSRERTEETEIQGVLIKELSVDDNLLYLICHVLKHYIRSGFGIRQICDILLFCQKNAGKIDYEAVFSRLSHVFFDGFAADIFRIGEEYFGFRDVLPERLAERGTDFKKLLDDVLAAGVFGKSSAERMHSAALTLSAVRGENSIGKSAAGRAFISFSELQTVYPQMKDRKWLYPYYSLVRLSSYLKRTKGIQSAGQSIKIASQRISQIDSYGLIASVHCREFDDAVISAIKSRLESGKTARLKVTGSSMVPFLVSERDRVELAKINNPVSVGDVILYKRTNGAYVLHRVMKITADGFYFAGDRQTRIEGPIKREQLLAVCVSFERKGKKITGRELPWKIYNAVWRRLLRVRHWFLNGYEKMKK